MSREPGVEQEPLRVLWGMSDRDFFAFGPAIALRYDGASWRPAEGGGGWGFGARLWGTSDHDLFGFRGGSARESISHFDGASWTEQVLPCRASIEGLWGSSSENVFAVGRVYEVLAGAAGSSGKGAPRSLSESGVLHFDGSSWKEMLRLSGPWLTSVHGASEDDVYAVGEGGIILHFDGIEWSEEESGSSVDLRYVRVGEDGIVFAVDGYGAVLVREAGGWTLRSSGAPELFDDAYPSIWGTSVSDVWAASHHEWILHFNGVRWSRVDTGFGVWFNQIWGVSPGEPFVACETGAVIRCAAGEWVLLREGTQSSLWEVHGARATGVLAMGGRDHGALLRSEGGAWRTLRDSFAASFRSIWCEEDGSVVLAGTSRSLHSLPEEVCVVRLIGDTQDTLLAGFQGAIDGLWSSSPGELIAVGRVRDSTGARGVIYRLNGAVPEERSAGRFWWLTDVWGAGADDIFAVGQRGEIVHWNGEDWSRMESGVDGFLNAVWGLSGSDVFAVGDLGTILHFDGKAWSMQESGTFQDLYDIWGSPDVGMIAVGSRGTILHYDGCRWSPCPRVDWSSLFGVWGSEEDGIFAVGQNGIVLWAATPIP
ncbi:MAG: hypothetical protein FJY73_09445 [Candidatus Eisenbacteria bacterium]|nr:hypothetical protein [Candidatus Eisenbacteria bacterium]